MLGLWWPACEAMVAFAMAYQQGRDPKHLERFVKTATHAFATFADGGKGEWFGYADRRNEPTHAWKAGPYKGCFHVPRALLKCHQILSDALKQ